MQKHPMVPRPHAEWSFVMVLGGPRGMTKKNTQRSLLQYKVQSSLPMNRGTETHDKYMDTHLVSYY